MAEGLAKEYASDLFEVYSAGTEPAPAVKPNAVKAMEEIGINIDEQYPKKIEEIPSELDILITMGCGVECPYIPCKYRKDWELDDPAGKPIEEFRKTREIIKEKVKKLVAKVNNEEITMSD
jgi:arsenate reductase